MRSYRLESFGAPLVEQHADTPRPRGHEVVVKIGSCGVCHSDVHLADGYFDLGNGARVALDQSLSPPRTLGHEIAGTVVAVGPEVIDVAIGDRRVVYPWIGCGACATCATGEEQLCPMPRALGINVDGGFADHVLVAHERYLLDYAPLSEEQACTCACSGLTAFGALKKVVDLFEPDSKKTLLIIGAGGVGLSGIRMATRLGLPAPVVAEVDRGKWELAREAGAADVIDPTEANAARTLVRASGGGVLAAIDFVGAGETFAFGFGVLRKNGTLVSVGLFGGTTSLSPALIALKSLRIVGSYVGSPADFRELIDLMRTSEVPALPLTHLPLAEAGATLEALKHGRIRGRAILKP